MARDFNHIMLLTLSTSIPSPFTWPSKLFFYYRAGVPKAWGGDYVYAGNEFCNDDFLAPNHPRTLNPRKYSSPGGPFSNGWSNVVLGCREGSQN